MAVGYGNYNGYAGALQPASPPGPIPAGQGWGSQAAGQVVGTALGVGQTAQPQNFVNPSLQGFLNTYQQGVANPILQNIYGQISDLGNQDIQQQMQAQLQGQNLQQESGFSLANLGLDVNQLGVQQGTLTRQEALLPQQYGLQTQGFDLSQQAAQYGAMQNMRNLNSSATASGAFTAAGTNASRGDINEQLQNTLANLGLQRQGAALNFEESKAQQQDAQKQLDIQSKRLGISGDEIKSRLDNALQQLGISSQISSEQILAEQGKVAQGIPSAYEPLFADLYSMIGSPIGGQ